MNTPQQTHPKGVTLIELTVVITMILTLSSSLFFSASYYRDSSDKAACIVQLESMQKAVRSYQNFNSLSAGNPITKSDLVGPGKAIASEVFCPHSGGVYVFKDEIPAAGVAFATCSDYDATTGTKDQSLAHNYQNISSW